MEVVAQVQLEREGMMTMTADEGSMTQPLSHPSAKRLGAFVSGRLSPEEANDIESHISECDQCCETLVSLSAADTFVDLLHEAGNAGDHFGDTFSKEIASRDSISSSLANHPRYEVIERIGTGGMGDVYTVRHRVMNRTVALKVINQRLVQHPQAVERFRHEVHAAAQLSHSNIVAAYDAEQADDLHFLVMEHVAGVNLAEHVAQRGPMPAAEACDAIRQAAIGLQYAHEQGMIHRDIKPQNLMIGDDGTVKVLDFGLATLASQPSSDDLPPSEKAALTSAGSIVGTPDYISPEQAGDAHSADIRSDIYSLGASLYFLLSGRPPFIEGGVAEKLQSHISSEPEAIESICNDVPVELAEIIRRMMARNPDERFQTASEVVAALEPFVPQDAQTDSQQFAERKRRRKGALVALATAAFLLLAGIIYVVTDKGTLVIDSMDDDIEVIIRRSGREMQIVDTVTGTKASRLPCGEYEVSIRGKQNTYTLDKDRFELRRGTEAVVTVLRKENDNPDITSRKATQLASIAAINELGGRMRFDKENPSLVTVSFSSEKIRDEDLVHVQRLENIKTLYLPNTSVTDAGLRDHVSKMKTLVNLYLVGSKVTEDGLQYLLELDKLKVLYIGDLPIGDEVLETIAQLDGLVGLSLDRTQITDEGISQHIATMPNISMLFLRGTKVTDEGLSSLHKLKKLHHLDIKETHVTDSGVEAFKNALPDCKVAR